MYQTQNVLPKLVWLDTIESVDVAASRRGVIWDAVLLVQEKMGEDAYRLESENLSLLNTFEVVSQRFR